MTKFELFIFYWYLCWNYKTGHVDEDAYLITVPERNHNHYHSHVYPDALVWNTCIWTGYISPVGVISLTPPPKVLTRSIGITYQWVQNILRSFIYCCAYLKFSTISNKNNNKKRYDTKAMKCWPRLESTWKPVVCWSQKGKKERNGNLPPACRVRQEQLVRNT